MGLCGSGGGGAGGGGDGSWVAVDETVKKDTNELFRLTRGQLFTPVVVINDNPVRNILTVEPPATY